MWVAGSILCYGRLLIGAHPHRRAVWSLGSKDRHSDEPCLLRDDSVSPYVDSLFSVVASQEKACHKEPTGDKVEVIRVLAP